MARYFAKHLPVVEKLARLDLQATIASYAGGDSTEAEERGEAVGFSGETLLANLHCVAAKITLADFAHTSRGAKMFVSKQVSEDLLRSDIPSPDFASVSWPADLLEVEFEDELIPTVMLDRNPIAPYAWAMSVMGVPYTLKPDTDDRISIVFGDSDLSRLCVMTQTVVEMNKLAGGEGELGALETGDDTIAARALRTGQQPAMASLLLLLFKVLMFADTPKFKPTQKKHKFGKARPGFLRPPDMRKFIVEYLPKHIEEKRAEAAKLGGSHAFRGRRGHFRTYHSERYTNKRGDKDYMWPIPNPHGEDVRRKFIVRK